MRAEQLGGSDGSGCGAPVGSQLPVGAELSLSGGSTKLAFFYYYFFFIFGENADAWKSKPFVETQCFK